MKQAVNILILTFFLPIIRLSPCEAGRQDELSVATWYGDMHFSSPGEQLFGDLLHSQPIQRLKQINQYGVIQLVDTSGQNDEPYSRYDHSVGVLYLLRRFQAPYKEQVSGLLHDVSHTAFSHVSDYLHTESPAGNPNFHDSLFTSFLEQRGLSGILDRYGLSVAEVDPKKPAFARLERELPDLCADRLDYILQGAGRRGVLTQSQSDEILNALLFDEKTAHWYVKSRKAARRLAEASIELNSKIFATAWGLMLYQWTAEALRRLITLGDLSTEDVLYHKTDAQIWNILSGSKDPQIEALMRQMTSSWYSVSETVDPEKADRIFKNIRCRVIDPRVLSSKGWERLSAIDSEFRQRVNKELNRCRNIYVRINR
ncbi:HD domain-containing protein [Endozoicomonas euniceicola]|uniref:HD domain-containing protein n=1 Tax=Endozoicomonas euniceicola TaxID=1234143 RepID=A0ABY6GTA9_9GAMM|nr:HD domain-containing protein [Endozoicomonas euniceicola]UYM15995.1 HD domain-containing protein [Endozoicomonas euniceicola]